MLGRRVPRTVPIFTRVCLCCVCDEQECTLKYREHYSGVLGRRVPGTVPIYTRVYLGYVCDSNVDCEDGYDENPELCAAGIPSLSVLRQRQVIQRNMF